MEKPWTINDDYRYAPKKEGDPWQRMLDPILKKEKIRCDGWKDEVGNLLIFAGLFSAVVTAFIIESYKTLQPDPSIDIVGLLSQISAQLDGAGNGATQFLFNSTNLPSQSFIPTQSAIHVNVFWFLSLIFSLTTVLVGIVALQWLREYQTYPGQSARETLAIYHMRAEGMRKWHLSCCFFAGVTKFLDAIGSKAVAISTTIAIAFTLLFLVFTTILPAAQVIFLRLSLSLPIEFKRPPSQCPYKSPQAKLFCALFKTASSLVSASWKVLRDSQRQRIERLFTIPFAKIVNTKYKIVRRRLSEISAKRIWIEFDLGLWLSARDACHRVSHEETSWITTPEEFHEFKPLIALFDVMTILNLNQAKNLPEADYSDLYHCVCEISRLHTITTFDTFCPGIFDFEVQRLWQRNNYFRSFPPSSMWIEGDNGTNEHLGPDTRGNEKYTLRLTNFTSDSHITRPDIYDVTRLLHELNLYLFVADPVTTGHKPVSAHFYEINLRIGHYVFGRSAGGSLFEQNELFRYFDIKRCTQGPEARALLQQTMLVFKEFFDNICSPDAIISAGDLHANDSIPFLVADLGWLLSDEITNPNIPFAIDSFLEGLSAILSTSDSEIPQSNLAHAMLYAAELYLPIELTLQEMHLTNDHANALYALLVSFFRPCLDDEPTNTADAERRILIETNLAHFGQLYYSIEYLRDKMKKQTAEGVDADFHSQGAAQACSTAPSSNPEHPRPQDLIPPSSSPILHTENIHGRNVGQDRISPSDEGVISQPEAQSSSDGDAGLNLQAVAAAATLGDMSPSHHSMPIPTRYSHIAQSNVKSGSSSAVGTDDGRVTTKSRRTPACTTSDFRPMAEPQHIS